ncbi:MobA/MobL family protein [Roseococcus sp. MDT2-1-1]|uniref:MobA/MobL family protein n=2 Tax=Sabulicella glaciei TaxID=2984948 RepID=A0ABT3NZE7_9PROT|nr:MobA/MobL family protein [Roseococcus sp. MDT2-1-1]
MSHISRSGGASAMAMGAYDSGETLTCARTGRTYSYDKPDIVCASIMVPKGCDHLPQATDRAALWNSAEAAEDEWATRHFARAEGQARSFMAAHPDRPLAGEVVLPDGLTAKEESTLVSRIMREQVRPFFPPGHAGLVLTQDVLTDETGERLLRWQAVPPAQHHTETARTALRFIIALPRDLTEDQQRELAEAWLEERFVRHGYVADFAIRWTVGNPHLHVRVTRRALQPDGTWADSKDRGITTEDGLRESRRSFVEAANVAMVKAGLETRCDWRSYEDAGVALRPTVHEGYWSRAMALAGQASEAQKHNAEVWAANAEAVLEDPEIIIREVARQRATFTERDLLAELWKRTQGEEVSFLAASERLLASPLVEAVGAEPDSTPRYALKEYLATERAMFEHAARLAATKGHHGVDGARLEAAMGSGGAYARLSNGTPRGTGSWAWLPPARQPMDWRARRASPQGGRSPPCSTPTTLSRCCASSWRMAARMENIRRQRPDASDPANPDWMRKASEQLAQGEVMPALLAYDRRGRVGFGDDTDAAVKLLVDRWWEKRKANPGCSTIALAYTRAHVGLLNKAMRDRRVICGELSGPAVTVGGQALDGG